MFCAAKVKAPPEVLKTASNKKEDTATNKTAAMVVQKGAFGYSPQYFIHFKERGGEEDGPDRGGRIIILITLDGHRNLHNPALGFLAVLNTSAYLPAQSMVNLAAIKLLAQLAIGSQ